MKISCLAFSPDGTRLAVARNEARKARRPRVPSKKYLADVCRTVSILRVPSLQTETVIERDYRAGNQGPAVDLFRFPGNSLAFRQDPGELALLESGGGKVWSCSVDGSPKRLIVDPSLPVFSLHSSHDQTTWATGHDGGVTLWDAVTGKKLRTIWADLVGPHSTAPFIAFSPDDKLIAMVDFVRVTLWDTTTGAKRADFVIHDDGSDYNLWFACSPVGEQLAVGLHAGARVYDFKGNQIAEVRPAGRVRSVRFSPDGKELAAGTVSNIQVFDVRTGQSVRVLPSSERTTCIAYSPDGRLLASGDGHGRVALWNAETGDLIARVTPPGGRPVNPLLWVGAAGVVFALLWELKVSRRHAQGEVSRTAGVNAGPDPTPQPAPTPNDDR